MTSPKRKYAKPNSPTDRQIEKILKYHSGGVSVGDIGKMLDMPTSTVQDQIKRFMPTKAHKQALDIFQARKADILSIFQRKMLYGITDEQINAMSVPQRMMAFGILFDKERLLRGQPTSISAVASVISRIRGQQKEVEDRIASLRRANKEEEGVRDAEIVSACGE